MHRNSIDVSKHLCARMRRDEPLVLPVSHAHRPVGLSEGAQAQSLSESTATTEQSCSFGMAKGEASQSCHVPFPTGCLVASIPETDKPWTTISKGGKTFCRFDDKATDWKTKITGSCGRCKSDHCSVQFIVRFDCSQQSH